MAPPKTSPRGLVLGNCPQIQNKLKQSKNCTGTLIFLHLPELLLLPNDCSQKVSQYIAVCVVYSSELAWISSDHMDKILP